MPASPRCSTPSPGRGPRRRAIRSRRSSPTWPSCRCATRGSQRVGGPEAEGAGEIVWETVDFHDIAGLVAGAHRGEGLGNRFLANIRETDAIVHVVRAHADDSVVHPEGRVDPLKDVETVEAELALADLEQ